MKKLETLAIAPDFDLVDTQGQRQKLSAYRNHQPVVLVMTRGFV